MSPDDLAKILDELGRRLGPAGEHVFALAVRQVYIDASIGLVSSVLVLAALTIGTLYAIRMTRRLWAADVERSGGRGYPYDADRFPYVMVWLIGGLILAFVAGSAALVLTSSLARLLNSEYAALRDILGAIGGSR